MNAPPNSSGLRIASITHVPSASMGGLQRSAGWLCALAREAGHHVEEISRPLAPWQRNEMLYALWGQFWQLFLVGRMASRRRRDFDAFIVHAPTLFSAGPGLTIFRGSLWEYTRRAYPIWHPNHWKLRLVNENLERLSARGPRTIVAICHSQAEALRKLGIRADHVIYNPVRTDLFVPARDRAAVRRELGWAELGPDAFVALWVGRPARGKGLNRVTDLAARFPSAAFYFAGPEKPTRGSLPPNCRWLGEVPRDKIHALYQASDLFISFSAAEGFGNALIEAMSTGLPFLATPTGLAADLVREGGILSRGIVAHDGRDDDRAFELFYKNAELRKELGEAARRFAIENADEPKIAAKYRKLIDAIAESSANGP